MILDFISETTSTNSALRQMVTDRLSEHGNLPRVWALCAGYQSAGRGAGTNTWYSSKDQNILLSICFQPDLLAADQFLFNIYFSLATHKFISRYIHDVKIKWPNDMYVGDEKIAGILIEHNITAGKVSYSIAGIGIDVNEESFPKEIPNPTSFFIKTSRKFDCRKLTEEFVGILEEDLHLLRTENAVSLFSDYKKNLYRIGETHEFESQGVRFSGIIRDVDRFGRVMIEKRPEGVVEAFEYKQVRYVL